jgi:phosphoribosylaminoimidazolecarboxamide formyltransferase/IMP cyclohydrolase
MSDDVLGLAKIRRAVVSVSNKSGLDEFALFLKEKGVEILSTGGTKKFLDGIGVNPIEVSAYTGFPEIMDGRVKTLHPKIHGGILNIRDNLSHQEAKNLLEIKDIDLIVVNLYPFRETIARPDVTLEEAIENIDIGGPSMIRAAAKNYKYVTVVVDPADYSWVMGEMRATDGATSEALRLDLAKRVFSLTSRYDQAIYDYLEKR